MYLQNKSVIFVSVVMCIVVMCGIVLCNPVHNYRNPVYSYPVYNYAGKHTIDSFDNEVNGVYEHPLQESLEVGDKNIKIRQK